VRHACPSGKRASASEKLLPVEGGRRLFVWQTAFVGRQPVCRADKPVNLTAKFVYITAEFVWLGAKFVCPAAKRVWRSAKRVWLDAKRVCPAAKRVCPAAKRVRLTAKPVWLAAKPVCPATNAFVRTTNRFGWRTNTFGWTPIAFGAGGADILVCARSGGRAGKPAPHEERGGSYLSLRVGSPKRIQVRRTSMSLVLAFAFRIASPTARPLKSCLFSSALTSNC